MAKLLDPVCGMTVDDTSFRAPGYDDVAFCAPGCRTTFLNNPAAYTNRLDGAEPMAKMCTCGEHDHAEHETHDDVSAEPVAAGSGCCGGHGH